MKIVNASLKDLDNVSSLEIECFNKEMAASKETFKKRIETYGDYFYLLYEGDILVSMVDSLSSNDQHLIDEMYHDESFHQLNGTSQMLLGVLTKPSYEGKGYASKLLEYVINDLKKRNKELIVLTCLKDKISFYERFGFINQGLSTSNHGSEKWYEMSLDISK
ncbi:MAG: GNAT family N-acetyltransferase [Thomasclavelia sp.]|nr:GNAT family N-acetyltransferase [Thomasclavelia sp.]